MAHLPDGHGLRVGAISGSAAPPMAAPHAAVALTRAQITDVGGHPPRSTIAYLYEYANFACPFRGGNGRAAREFFDLLPSERRRNRAGGQRIRPSCIVLARSHEPSATGPPSLCSIYLTCLTGWIGPGSRNAPLHTAVCLHSDCRPSVTTTVGTVKSNIWLSRQPGTCRASVVPVEEKVRLSASSRSCGPLGRSRSAHITTLLSAPL